MVKIIKKNSHNKLWLFFIQLYYFYRKDIFLILK